MSIKKCLFRAVRNGDARIVTAMLAARANPNTRRNSQTALHVAAENDDVAIINILIEAGADLEARNRSGQTALHEAAEDDNVAALKALIEAGVDLNAQDNAGNTALHEAVEDGEVAALNILIEAGADLNAQDNAGNTALQAPTISRYIEVILAFGWTPPHNE